MWNGHIIMDRKEKEIIEESARQMCETFRPRAVLEFGFGYGFTAHIFREYAKIHRIVEVHPQIADYARNLKFDIVESPVADYLDDETYDFLYDDHYPFPGIERPNYRNFRYRYLAKMFEFNPTGETGFIFTVKNMRYFQPVLENHENND